MCWPQWRRAVLFRRHPFSVLLVNRGWGCTRAVLLVAGMVSAPPMTNWVVATAEAVVVAAAVTSLATAHSFSTGREILGVGVRLAVGAQA